MSEGGASQAESVEIAIESPEIEIDSPVGEASALARGAQCPRDARCPRPAGHPGHCKLQGAVAAAVVAAVAAVEATACASCGSIEDEPGSNDILLCDACDTGYHMHCLVPPLEAVPAGDWFCARCERGVAWRAGAARRAGRCGAEEGGKAAEEEASGSDAAESQAFQLTSQPQPYASPQPYA